MKHCYFILLFFLFLYSASYVHAMNLPLLGKVIYLDAGHGGEDPGAVYNNIYESNINLEVSLLIQEYLEKMGAIVMQTRYGNYDLSNGTDSSRKLSDLSNRVKMINESDANLYLSIHLNADASEKWSGAQVFYSNHLEKNGEIALELQRYLVENLDTTRVAKEIEGVYMYKRVNVPGVLIELGFLSNPNERYLLTTDSYKHKISEIITSFIVEYFES